MKSSAGGERQLTGRDPYRWRGTTVFRTGRVSREVLNPSLQHLLAVIDEAAPACA